MGWPWKGRERRRYERIKTAVPCRLQVGDRVLIGATRDLSMGGICFTVEIDDNVRAEIARAVGTVSAILPGGTMESECRVIRAQEGAVATQFVNFKGNPARDLLHAFLETQVSRMSTDVPDGDGEED
jgi:c-di-GMP-binding flagellar brake protein YcgR